ncbi:MAG: hypothetical protein MUP66_02495 [Candidatus Nanohaloarchaeota archaeon QJJ-5]|nr:hypothetical protein [Candidatus Nanohaloarchaeota archaeon QJJ-5]
MAHLNSFILALYTGATAAVWSGLGVESVLLGLMLAFTIAAGAVIEELVQRIYAGHNQIMGTALAGAFTGLGAAMLAGGYYAGTVIFVFAGLGYVIIGYLMVEIVLGG